MADTFTLNMIVFFALLLIGLIALIVWQTRKNKIKLDETAYRLAELRLNSRRTVEEEAEMIKLEVWLRRYENQTRPRPSTNSET